MPVDPEVRMRRPSIPTKITDITQRDVRISVTGTVIEVAEHSISVDDGTGKIDISFESPLSAKLNQLVRVFGKVVPAEGGVELAGELLQDMTGLDVALRRRAEMLLEHA
jgi:hypothetical protein